MQAHERRLTTGDGHNIPIYHWESPQPKAVIHLLHGMSEHALCYADVATELTAAGYHVAAHDHRCHGHACSPAQLGQADERNSFERICDDVLLVNTQLRHQYPGLPIFLLGHSMGSFIALIFAQRHPCLIHGLLLEGSGYNPPWFLRLAAFIARIEARRQGANGQSRLLHRMSFGDFNRHFRPARSDYDWLSRDQAFVDRYLADPLCGRQVSNLFWAQMLSALVAMSQQVSMNHIDSSLPVYLFAGDRDPVGKMGRSVRHLQQRLQRAQIRQVDLRLYAQARHDLLHETCRAEVMRDLLAWLAQTPALQAGASFNVPAGA